jgi:hypothetical protein
MKSKPYVFIGSSSEGLQIASAIKANLDNDADLVIWNQNAFEIGITYLESLQKQMHKADFAILVLTEDDITISRNQKKPSPRDNVLFELGLAIGQLGRERCFFVYDNSKDFKLPSDLSGINGATYRVQESGNLTASLGTACNKIREMLYQLDVRFKIEPTTVDSYHKLYSFCKKIEGCWWERIKPDTQTALSFVRIYVDKENIGLKFEGRSFDGNGNYTAFWESNASSINHKERKVLYYWTGGFPLNPSEPYEGVGEISFFESGSEFETAVGVFSNINITDLKSISKKSFELRRSTNEEIKIMDSNDKKKICSLIVNKIEKMF